MTRAVYCHGEYVLKKISGRSGVRKGIGRATVSMERNTENMGIYVGPESVFIRAGDSDIWHVC